MHVLKTGKKTPSTASSGKSHYLLLQNPDWLCFTVSYTNLPSKALENQGTVLKMEINRSDRIKDSIYKATI